MGKAVAFVTGSIQCLPKPGDGFVHLAFLHQLGTDVIVGIAEIGIDFDRSATLGNRIVEPFHVAIRPAKKGVGFGGRKKSDRLLVHPDSLVESSVDLVLVCLVKQVFGTLSSVVFTHVDKIPAGCSEPAGISSSHE